MKKYEIEISRSNVTPAQFLAYVRAQLKKKGLRDISSDLGLDYFRKGNDLNFDYHDIPGKPCKAEKSVSKPYEMQTYVRNWDGTCYNEICEFDFDDEKTGHGYYYLLNTVKEETAEEATEETTEETTEQKKDITMKNTKTLYDVSRKLTLFAPDKLVALKCGNDTPFWIGRAKFVFGAVTAQAMCLPVLAVETGDKLTTIILP